jgi:hypothetical protein
MPSLKPYCMKRKPAWRSIIVGTRAVGRNEGLEVKLDRLKDAMAHFVSYDVAMHY